MATKDLEQITHFDGVMITSGTENGGRFNVNSTLNPPTVISDAQRNTIENTNNKAAPIKKGTLVYNEEANSVQAFQGADAGSWVSLGAGGGGGAGTVTSVGIIGSTGLSVSGSPITIAGDIELTLGTELQGLSAVNADGFVVRTGLGAYVERTITGDGNIVVTNGSGANGNTQITIGDQISLETITIDQVIFQGPSVETNTATIKCGVSTAPLDPWMLPGTQGLEGNILALGPDNAMQWVAPTLGTVTSITAGTGLDTGGSSITSTGTISLANTTVVAGTYNITGGTSGAIASIIVDAQGRITSITTVA